MSEPRPSPTPLDDLTMVRRLLAGDEEARTRFVHRMRCVARLLAHHNRRLGHPLAPAEVRDLGQDVLLAIWRKLPTFRGGVALETWTYRFCQLGMLHRLRKLRRLPHFLDGLDREGAVAPLEQPPEPFQYENVHLSIERLPERESQVVRLKHFDGLTFEEIAAQVGISPNTAKTRYYKAIATLRRVLSGRLDAPQPREELSS